MTSNQSLAVPLMKRGLSHVFMLMPWKGNLFSYRGILCLCTYLHKKIKFDIHCKLILNTNNRRCFCFLQPIWKPFPNQDSDLSSVLSGTGSELHIPRVCEFCQAVFPPSITSRGDFLRHLNSHFNGET